jgi:NADPH:quinone reductase-like Zn-dependent oxidoreductase
MHDRHLPQDFVPLREGDWVVQNGANSAAGTAVIQLCKAWGLQSINVRRHRFRFLWLSPLTSNAQIVRDRDDIDQLRSRLRDLGATHVLTTSDLEDKAIRKRVASLTSGAPVRLGLNCVSGPSTTHLASRILTDDATLGACSPFPNSRLPPLTDTTRTVTYGAMSKQPLSLPSSLHIFKGLVSRGFWLSAWYASQPSSARASMAAELVDLFETGRLVEPEHEVVALAGTDDEVGARAREAARRSMSGFGGKKLLFRFDEA